MHQLPDEILVDVLDYLEPSQLISTQRVSPRMLKVARDNSLWRCKCFERAPSAASIANQPHTITTLTGALGSLSLGGAPTERPSPSSQNYLALESRARASRRARLVAEWDCTNDDETIDWYSEYIARNAPLYKRWNSKRINGAPEVRGIAVFADSNRAIGPLEDGSFSVWDITASGGSPRTFRELDRAATGVLFKYTADVGASSAGHKLAFSNVTECISIDSSRNKAYIAVANLLNELDLETLDVLSQNKYAWPITALSREGSIECPLTVGTTWSLNLYDPRAPFRNRSRSPEDLLRTNPADPEDSIAFLPNYAKDSTMRRSMGPPLPPTFPQPSLHPSIFAIPHFQQRQLLQRVGRRELTEFAHIEPGPLSILHHGQNDILIAGRFPSILSYDRRYFPRLQHAVHSGARLSCLTAISHPPKNASQASGAEATLVACGEYGGRGSLELYCLPHVKQGPRRDNDNKSLVEGVRDQDAADHELTLDGTHSGVDEPFSYKNRQEASSAKLLSVASQGTRIVFSDAEGGLKWVERNGRGLARRWNINNFEVNHLGASIQGEQVIRKIVPLEPSHSERGDRGDGDLLVWTGERVGIVTTKLSRLEDELADAFDEKMNLDDEKDIEEEYNRTMRRALERQADERRWMTRFRLR